MDDGFIGHEGDKILYEDSQRYQLEFFINAYGAAGR